MPVLNWIGKEQVVNHDKDVPFRLLNKVSSLSTKEESENLIIEGDNLEALKSLMPYYAGQIKCIYIDPPYNTGNEKWVYNDRVNSPEIRKWLGKVVGSEGEDLNRHDKWLCMMYPRLKLLRDLLSDDGVIFVSIDDIEVHFLKMVMNEIFGDGCFIEQIIWKNKFGAGAKTKGFISLHEYILCYSKKEGFIKDIKVPLSERLRKMYSKKDEKFEKLGPYATWPLETTSMDERKNLRYPILYKGKEIWPKKQWLWSKERIEKAIEENRIVFNENKGKVNIRFKGYLYDESGELKKGTPISIYDGPYTQEGTKELMEIFGKSVFSFPKPSKLIKNLINITINNESNKDAIILDSFAGSGPTGHAVLDINKEDGGNRKFILVEMENKIAQDITAERVKRVIRGYSYNGKKVAGLGGGFQFMRLGTTLFDADGFISEDVTFKDLAQYIYFTETKTALNTRKIDGLFIGEKNDTEYYLLFNGIKKNVIDNKILRQINKNPKPKIIYADRCLIDKQTLARHKITFKQIPYEVKIY
ncbi:MAG: site-specific DNA-methyltransferase [Planctomycetota bacterium]|nr:site-specific DNA-methyltransferase [Planctomycetota bacterium]